MPCRQTHITKSMFCIFPRCVECITLPLPYSFNSLRFFDFAIAIFLVAGYVSMQ